MGAGGNVARIRSRSPAHGAAHGPAHGAAHGPPRGRDPYGYPEPMYPRGPGGRR